VWAVEHGLAATPPTWEVRSVALPKDRGRESFKTLDQIARVLKRGRVPETEKKQLWETLFPISECATVHSL